jgi:hypothetical protein
LIVVADAFVLVVVVVVVVVVSGDAGPEKSFRI